MKEAIQFKYNNFIKSLKKKFEYMKKEYSYLLKPFIAFIIIYALAYYPIIRANFNYNDDIGRVYFGYSNWNDFSRFISHYFSAFIHSGRYLTDVSPLPQLIAVVVLAISSIMIIHIFKSDKKISLFNIIALIPIGLSPYFLECISYKYDSPYMALSILGSIFPFLFYKNDSKYNIPFCIAVFIGTNIMCMTYQAASGIIPLMTLFLAFKYWNDKDLKSCGKLIVLAALSYFLGLIFFKVFIMIPANSYASSALLDIKHLIPGIFNNLGIYYENVIHNDFRKVELVLIGLLILSFIIIQVINSKQNKIIACIITCITLVLGGIITFGIYPALAKPIFVNRAMYGFGILLALISFNITNIKKAYIPKLIAVSFSWFLFTFSFTYGNFLNYEKEFIEFKNSLIVSSLNDMEIINGDNPVTIKLYGFSDHTPVIDNIPIGYKNKLQRLVPCSLSGYWQWGIELLKDYYAVPNVTFETYDSEVLEDLTLYKDTLYYRIETNNVDYILITIKNKYSN